jgi:hypothetical protein
MLLFLGYKLSNLDCRVMLRSLFTQMEQTRGPKPIAVIQIPPEEAQEQLLDELREYMKRCCAEELQFQVFEGSVRDFLKELRKRWEADYGNL